MTTTYDDMSMAELVRAYNNLAAKKRRKEGDLDVHPVSRFKDKATGIKRCLALSGGGPTEPSEETRQVTATEAAATDKPKTIKQLTDDYNALVPEAVSLGLSAKHHTSNFGDKAGAERQITKLAALIEAAKAAKAA